MIGGVPILIWLFLVELIVGRPIQHDLTGETDTNAKIIPKVLIVSNYNVERDLWLESRSLQFNNRFSIPGLYSFVHCTDDNSVCHVTINQDEINPATSIMALSLSSRFNLSQTYWIIAGFSEGDQNQVTIGSTIFAKYVTHVDLESYIHYQTNSNHQDRGLVTDTSYPFYNPQNLYGIKIIELNQNLRNHALQLSTKDDTPANFGCDVLSMSDIYSSNNYLASYIHDYTKLMTNDSATYCSINQHHDKTSLEALQVLHKMHTYGLLDFERIVVMNTILSYSNTTPNNGEEDHHPSHSLPNLVQAGSPFITDIINNWDLVYAEGRKYRADNHIGVI